MTNIRDCTISFPIYTFINERHCQQWEKFQTNLSIYSINTRNKQNLHSPNANLSC